jgi:hypothetical protein
MVTKPKNTAPGWEISPDFTGHTFDGYGGGAEWYAYFRRRKKQAPKKSVPEASVSSVIVPIKADANSVISKSKSLIEAVLK